MIGLFLVLGLAPAAKAQEFSDWSAPVNLGPVVNTPAAETTDPMVSKSGLSLYFSSPRPGGFGGYDIWVSQRATVDDPWGPPQNLGPTVNSAFNENTPFLSTDGHVLLFTSDRTGGYGGSDLYISRRHNKRDDFDWRVPENLGGTVNTSANETQPDLFEDDATGAITLYFASNRPGGLGNDDIYASTLQADETFGSPALVTELSSASQDRKSSIRRDGLEVYIVSNRPGSMLNLQGLPSYDIWVSTRATTSDPWSSPVNVGAPINTGRHDGGPSLSFDGTALYFHSAQRLGNVGVGCPNSSTCFFDIWMSTRTKIKGTD